MIKISFLVNLMDYSLFCAGIHQCTIGEPCEIRPREIVDRQCFSPCKIHPERLHSSGGGTGTHNLLQSQRAQRVSPLVYYLYDLEMMGFGQYSPFRPQFVLSHSG